MTNLIAGLSDGSVVHMMKSKGQVLPHTADDSPENAGSQQTEEQLRQAGGNQRKVTTNIPAIDNLMERLGPGNRLERVMDANPEIMALLKNPEQMQEMMNIAINPELRLEYMRNMDRALSNIEAIPGGYNALASMMSDVSEAPESSEGISNERQNSKNPFLRLFKQTGSVNENPIPNPWRSPSAPTVSARPSIRSEEEITSVVERLFSEERVGDLISAMEDPNRRLRASESTSEDSERVILESTLTADNMRVLSRVLTNPQFRSMLVRQVLEGSESTGITDDMLVSMLDSILSQDDPISEVLSDEEGEEPQISEEEMLKKIQVLNDMGFCDEEANRDALESSGGDVDAAVERLLNM
eukprot:CAMPEP_0118801106 /NCGR_PEP_ID=MMETSP1161-20130426/2771_1 /TAXON_ID=249345 /ORGANISM="Picochlorum oklahomensis, Strain CCMP2329" /LENGTH=355 /DNA_ID=CAMNT_0006729005 /DNA_START=321 /DNA_END=1388 /DNA_ORIENTATION=+